MLTAHILQMYYQSLLLLYITVEQVFPAQWREAILGQTGSRAVMAEGAIICAPGGRGHAGGTEPEGWDKGPGIGDKLLESDVFVSCVGRVLQCIWA